jgi:hypothetical protein
MKTPVPGVERIRGQLIYARLLAFAIYPAARTGIPPRSHRDAMKRAGIAHFSAATGSENCKRTIKKPFSGHLAGIAEIECLADS